MNLSTRLVCAFVEPQLLGKKFKLTDWPLHVTIVPWFQLKGSESELNNDMQAVLMRQQAFTAHVDTQSHTRFNSRKVSLLRQSQWQDLHEKVLEVVARHAGVVATKLYIGLYYRPHVTFQKIGHLNPRDEFYCDSLYVVERQGRYRQIINRLELGHEAAT